MEKAETVLREKPVSVLAIGKMRANPTAQLKGLADHYEKCIQNITQYERIMAETDQDKRYDYFSIFEFNTGIHKD